MAIVALIAISSTHIARPQAPVPARPPHYASTSIELSEKAARLTLNQPDQPVDGATEARNAQSSEPVSDNTAPLEPVVPARPTAPSPLLSPPNAAVASEPVTMWWPAGSGNEDAAAVRQRVTEARSLRRRADAAAS